MTGAIVNSPSATVLPFALADTTLCSRIPENGGRTAQATCERHWPTGSRGVELTNRIQVFTRKLALFRCKGFRACCTWAGHTAISERIPFP